MAQRAALNPEVPIGPQCPFGLTGVGQRRCRAPQPPRAEKEMSFHLENTLEKARCGKAQCPFAFICFQFVPPNMSQSVCLVFGVFFFFFFFLKAVLGL